MTTKEQLFGIYKTIKAQLSEPEKARLLFKAKGLYEKAFPRSKRGGDHRSKNFKTTNQTDTVAVSFTKHAEQYTGKDERTIRRLVKLGELLSTTDPNERLVNEQIVERLAGTRIENSVLELTKLFEEPAEGRLVYANRMVDDKKVRAFTTAKYQVQRDQLLKQPTTYDFNPANLKYGDFRDFLDAMPEKSAQFVVSDIPYDNDHASILQPFAERAKRILKPGGLLIAMIGQWNDIFPPAVATFTQYLDWWGIVACNLKGQTAKVHGRNVAVSWKPFIVFRNGKPLDANDIHAKAMCRDSVTSPQPSKLYHPHEQSPEEFEHVLRSWGLPGDVVVDPFMGSGTTGVAALRCGMQFYGCDDGSCNDYGEYDGVGVGDKWVRIAQLRLDEESKRLKKLNSKPQLKEPQSIISAVLPILGAADPLQLTA